jgi:hypothetical protein
LDFRNLQFLKESYDMLIASYKASGKPLPTNTSKRSDVKNELFSRKLDCAVIEILHETRREEGLEPYDSVRGVFWEGPELYPKAGFREKDHIQICIRNPNCIKGYFLPRELDENWQSKLL